MTTTSRRITGAIATTLFAAGIAGCGSTTSGISQGSSATTKPGSGGTAPAASLAAAPDKLQVVATGFATGTMGTTGVAVIHNPSTTDGAANITVQFTAYGPGTLVLGTGSESLGIIRSGATQTAATDVTVSAGATVDHIVAQVSGTFTPDPHPTSVITATGPTFVPDADFPKVNAQLVSHYTADVKQVYAAAVCYNAAGAVDGGGFTFVDLLPGGGAAGASISVAVSGTPAKCDVTATLSNLSG